MRGGVWPLRGAGTGVPVSYPQHTRGIRFPNTGDCWEIVYTQELRQDVRIQLSRFRTNGCANKFVNDRLHKTQMRNAGPSSSTPLATLPVCKTPFTIAPCMLSVVTEQLYHVYAAMEWQGLICAVAYPRNGAVQGVRELHTARCGPAGRSHRAYPRPCPACTRSRPLLLHGHTLSTSVYAICLST